MIGAGADVEDLRVTLEAGYLAEHLPATSASYREIPDVAHFSFLQVCKPGAAERIDAMAPGEGVVCRDGEGRSREEIHRQVVDMIIGFLSKAQPAPRS